MKLKNFIKKLQDIEKRNGDSLQVRMADNILVVEPVLAVDKYGKMSVIISDRN